MPRKAVSARRLVECIKQGKAMQSDDPSTFAGADRYDFDRSEAAFLAYLGFENIRHGRQWIISPPLLRALYVYRLIGGPSDKKAFQAAAEMLLLKYKDKWDRDFAEACPSPAAFLATDPVPLYRVGDSEDTFILHPTHDMLDTGELRPQKTEEARAARNLVYAFLLWWLLRETERFDRLVFEEQEAEYSELYEDPDFPHPLPAFEDLQMQQQRKFPRPQWRCCKDLAPEGEALNRVVRALAFLPGWISRRGEIKKEKKKAHFSRGWHLFWIQRHESTFADDCPIHDEKWRPPWMRDTESALDTMQHERGDPAIESADHADSDADGSLPNDAVNAVAPTSGVKRTADDAGLPSGVLSSELPFSQYGPYVDEDDEEYAYGEHASETPQLGQRSVKEEPNGLAATLGPASKKLKLSSAPDQQVTRAATPDIREQRRQIAREGAEARQANRRPEMDAKLRADLKREHDRDMAELRQEADALAEEDEVTRRAALRAQFMAELLVEERAKVAEALVRSKT
ncbi:unnamed protein product [Zymoseptoria tritici ST99CH_1E4]|uniref:Uncharacterized protein n=1 Tax=Zymoseptoria tritici ST99CH_1E4 TaxID=1276532 RepID=A0A2H1GZ64_ZYMTR|nr:unnamed protein product [Zymoseptoria tritici ST99CH_1E4]